MCLSLNFILLGDIFFIFFELQTGTCALFFAAQGGFLDIVRILLDSGASLDLASYVSSLEGNTIHSSYNPAC